jgi:hypothetical protein
MKKYYTYAYLREDGTPYYVGKGSGKRINEYHSKFVKVPPQKRKIYLKQNLTEQEAFNHEIYMIAVFGRKDLGTGILVNRTDGGDNPPKNNIAGWNRGLRMSFLKERGEKISQALKGKQKSEEHKKKISEGMKGIEPWNKGKSRFKSEEERIKHKREYNKLRSARIRTEKKLEQDT